MKRLLPKTGRDLLVSLVLGASALGGSVYGQDTAAPANLPAAVPEIAPRAQPTTFGTAKGATFIVPLGGSKQLQMSSGKPIRTVYNRQDDVTSVEPTSDRTRLLVTGKKAGTSQITLIAEDQTKEVVDVVVQPDMEYLRSLLARAVPTANLNLIGAASGSIIIAGTVAKTEDVEIILNTARAVVGGPVKIINAMRVGGVQVVQLDCVIATVNRNKFRQLGFEFGSTGAVHSFLSVFSPPIGLASGGGTAVGGLSAGGIGSNANLATGLFNVGSGQTLIGFLNALNGESVSKLLAEPSVIALSGHPAQFYSGGEQAVPSISGGNSAATAGVDFKPFGTTLQVVPIVLGDGKIYLEVDPKVDIVTGDPLLGAPIPGAGGAAVHGRTGEEVHTSVVMEDGQTFVLAGLIQRTMDASVKRVPWLGDCPLIGTLFSSKNYTEGEQELVILITPHLVDAATCGQLPHYLPGQETRSPDDYELFYEGTLEAPHGCREVFPNGHYRPAYMNQGCSGGNCVPGTSDPAPVRNGTVVGSATPNPANIAPVPVPPSPPSAAMTADAPAPVSGTDSTAPTAKGL